MGSIQRLEAHLTQIRIQRDAYIKDNRILRRQLRDKQSKIEDLLTNQNKAFMVHKIEGLGLSLADTLSKNEILDRKNLELKNEIKSMRSVADPIFLNSELARKNQHIQELNLEVEHLEAQFHEAQDKISKFEDPVQFVKESDPDMPF